MSFVVAVIGGGQLARMMAGPATALGLTLRVLVESEDAAAALPAHQTVVGLPSDPQAVATLLAEPTPVVVTWEHEHIPEAVFAACEQSGIPARPGREALVYAQDKIAMRTKMDELGLPNPAWAIVETAADVDAFVAAHGGSAVVKTARGGYDGKGVRVVSSAPDVADWLRARADGGPALLIEQKVDFTRELAIQVARRPSGQVAAWPVVESMQRDGVCAEVIAPAPGLSERRQREIRDLAVVIATTLDVTGVLAVELFDTGDAVLINELAMRPHNSGHWTIDGAVTSQFEQHLRAVADLPLGDPSSLAPVAVMANVLGGGRRDLSGALMDVDDARVKIHLYGKGVRPGRKVGHVTVTGDVERDVRDRATRAARIVAEGGTS